MIHALGRLAPALGLALLAGCAATRTLVASPDDHADYRGVRLAAHEGTRLARARAYLARHPRGVYREEVNKIYETEEPLYFERSKETVAGARDYLASLPGGPHAAAALAVVRADYERAEDIALARELGQGRADEARFQRALAARREASRAVLDAVGALLDPGLMGARLDAPPASLVRAVHGPSGSLSGLPRESERDLFFVLPGRVERPNRVLTVRIVVTEEANVVRGLEVSGDDLFVHWLEADESVALDPTIAADRARAIEHAREVLEGALEARFPGARCAVRGPTPRPGERVVLARACGGAAVVVLAGERPGTADRLRVEPSTAE